jgi:hypothetical protein
VGIAFGLDSVPSTIAEFGVGIVFGLVAVLLMMVFKKVKGLVKNR